VALAEIIYGNTWHNIDYTNNQIALRDRTNILYITIKIPNGIYEKVTGLIETISNEITRLQQLKKFDLRRSFEISYKKLSDSDKCRLYNEY